MTPLRAKMIKAMQMHGFSPRTHESYLAAVTDLARYYRRSPDTLCRSELQRYFEHLVTERELTRRVVGCSSTAFGFCTWRCCGGRRWQCESPYRSARSASRSCSAVRRWCAFWRPAASPAIG